MRRNKRSKRWVNDWTPAKFDFALDNAYGEMVDATAGTNVIHNGIRSACDGTTWSATVFGEVDGYRVCKLLHGKLADFSAGVAFDQFNKRGWQLVMLDTFPLC
jgi:hypothetical protein